MADPNLILSTAAISLVGLPGIVLYTGGVWRRELPVILGMLGLWCAVGLVAVFTGIFVPGFAILVSVSGIVIAAGVSAALSEQVAGPAFRFVVVSIFSIVIFLPLAIVVFGFGGAWLYHELGALDFGGALPVALGAGTFCCALNARRDRHPRPHPRQVSNQTRILPRALIGSTLFGIAAAAMAVGLELRVDALTPTILLNMLAMPAVAGLCAAGAERAAHSRNSWEGLSAGVLAGVAAALACCAYLEVGPMLLVAALSGAVVGGRFLGASAASRLGTPLLSGGVVGLISLGVVEKVHGFVYSGQPMLLLQQVLICAAAVLFCVVVSFTVVFGFQRRLRTLEPVIASQVE